MLGWFIVVFVANPDVSENELTTERTRLASWDGGIGGRNWLDELVKENNLIYLGGNGYPYRYSGKASIVLPIIASGQPPNEGPDVSSDGYFISGKKVYSLQLNEVELSQCKPDDQLTIEVWDQS